MIEVVHVVGTQGVGKSVLIESMSARDAARGLQTGHVHEGYGISRAQALEMFPAADVVYFEHLHHDAALAEAHQGELVISIERAGQPVRQGA